MACIIMCMEMGMLYALGRSGYYIEKFVKTWYRAVCDEHESMCHIFVNNPKCTMSYLGDDSEDIHQWLILHYGCKLRLIHRDEELDEVLGTYDDGLTRFK